MLVNHGCKKIDKIGSKWQQRQMILCHPVFLRSSRQKPDLDKLVNSSFWKEVEF